MSTLKFLCVCILHLPFNLQLKQKTLIYYQQLKFVQGFKTHQKQSKILQAKNNKKVTIYHFTHLTNLSADLAVLQLLAATQ